MPRSLTLDLLCRIAQVLQSRERRRGRGRGGNARLHLEEVVALGRVLHHISATSAPRAAQSCREGLPACVDASSGSDRAPPAWAARSR